MEAKRRERIKAELRKSQEYLEAAEILFGRGLYTPSVMSNYYSAFHAGVAASLTRGLKPAGAVPEDTELGLRRLDERLDGLVGRLREAKKEWSLNASLEYGPEEAGARMRQIKAFCSDVRDLIRIVTR